MRAFAGIVPCMLASAAAAVTLPISGNYCAELFTVMTSGIEYEDGTCHFTVISRRVTGGWDIECEDQRLVIEPSKDGNTLTLTYPGDFDSYVLHRCPQTSRRIIPGQFTDFISGIGTFASKGTPVMPSVFSSLGDSPPGHRLAVRRVGQRYDSDLADEQVGAGALLIPPAKPGGGIYGQAISVRRARFVVITPTPNAGGR